MKQKMDNLDQKLKAIPKPTLNKKRKVELYEKIISPQEAFTDKLLVFLLTIVFFYISLQVHYYIFYVISSGLDFVLSGWSGRLATIVEELIGWVLLLLLFIFSYVIACKVSDFIQTRRKSFLIRIIAVLLLLFIVAHSLFAPYFYTDQYLLSKAQRLNELRYELYDTELTEKEFEKLYGKVYGDKSLAILLKDQYVEKQELISSEVVEMKRNYNFYNFRVVNTEKSLNDQGEEVIEKIDYQFTLEWHKWRIRMNGYMVMN